MNKLISGIAAVTLLASPVLAAASVDIDLFGSNPDTVYAGTEYSEPGYSSFSTFDGDTTSLVSFSGVDTSRGGSTARWYSVTDSNGDTANATRSITVLSRGNTMPWCSGPMSPGWVVSAPGGGCGGTATFIQPGQSVVVDGVLKECPFWFPSGCLIK